MRIHDWSKVDAGTFHDFHCSWIVHLKEVLNANLPKGFFAMAEQHAGRRSGDVLALHESEPSLATAVPEPTDGGAVAIADAPPEVARTYTFRSSPRASPRSLAIRHKTGKRIVALVELVSTSNKATRRGLDEFVQKVRAALRARVHVVVLDLLPPGKRDSDGVHGAIHEAINGEPYELPRDKRLTFVSYAAGQETTAYVEHRTAGDEIPELPLFLTSQRYVRLPLLRTYATAFEGMAGFVQDAVQVAPRSS